MIGREEELEADHSAVSHVVKMNDGLTVNRIFLGENLAYRFFRIGRGM